MAKAIRLLLLATGLLVWPLTAAAHAGPTARASIVNGTPATIAHFPFQAALLSRPALANPALAEYDTQFCGAFVLDARHVGTAAHCVFDDVNNRAYPTDLFKVLVGTQTLRKPGEAVPAGQDLVDVESVAFRPGFDPATYDDDAAVLTLSRAITIDTANVDEVPLASNVLVPDDLVTASGWGLTDPDDTTSTPQTLQEVEVAVIDDADDRCGGDEGYLGYEPTRMVCAAAPGKDTCAGDSGGPLVRMTPAGTRPSGWRLAGIVSFGAGCAQPIAGGVYAELSTSSGVNELDEFLLRRPTGDAPRLNGPHVLEGSPWPGQDLSCVSPWANASTVIYQVQTTSGTAREEQSGDPVYRVQPDDVGRTLRCVSRAQSDNGYGFARSAEVQVVAAPEPPPAPTPPPPPPPTTPPPPAIQAPAQKDTARPDTQLVRKRCTRTVCTLQLQVTDPVFTSGIRSLRASGRLEYRGRCRRDGRTRPCTRRRTLSVKPSLLAAGRYVVRVRSRTAGLATLRFTAYDVAGNRQARATQLRVRFGARR